MKQSSRARGRRLDLRVNEPLQLSLFFGLQTRACRQCLVLQTDQLFESLALLGAEKSVRSHAADDDEGIGPFVRELRCQRIESLASRPSVSLVLPSDRGMAYFPNPPAREISRLWSSNRALVELVYLQLYRGSSMLVPVVMRVRVLMPRLSRAVPAGDRLGRGEDEPAGLDALGADQVVGQVADLPRRPAQQDHFEAALLVEMDVGRGHDPVEMMMLQDRSAAARSARRDGRRSG